MTRNIEKKPRILNIKYLLIGLIIFCCIPALAEIKFGINEGVYSGRFTKFDPLIETESPPRMIVRHPELLKRPNYLMRHPYLLTEFPEIFDMPHIKYDPIIQDMLSTFFPKERK